MMITRRVLPLRHICRAEELDVEGSTTQASRKHRTFKEPQIKWTTEMQLSTLNVVASNLQIKQLSDWYDVSVNQFKDCGGLGLIVAHEYSVASVLLSLIPDHKWEPWKFTRVPHSYWTDTTSYTVFAESLGQSLGVKKPSDWYAFGTAEVVAHGGGGLLRHCQWNLINLLEKAYPGQKWHPWKFKQVPKNYWNSVTFSEFFRWLEGELKIQSAEDWYQFSAADICNNFGRGWLRRYPGGLLGALADHYPKHEWQEWQFPMVPPGYWNLVENQRRYFDWLATKLGHTSKSDWYQVTFKTVHENKGGGMLYNIYNDSIEQALRTVYPDHEWLSFERIKPGKESKHVKLARRRRKAAEQAIDHEY